MRSFMYTIKTPVGMHARHAGLLVREAERYRSAIHIGKGDREADARRILGLMGLGIRQGDVIRVTVEGEDEDEAALKLKAFLWSTF